MRRSLVLALGALVSTGCATGAGHSATLSRVPRTRPGAQSFLRLESSPAVFDVLYRYGQNTASPDGAYGPNSTDPVSGWYVESQRAGAVNVLDGILRPDQDPSLVASGLKMFRFGLQREAPSGAFPGSAWPFHGTALFLSEAGPALIALAGSGMSRQFSPELRWQIRRMHRAAYFMVHSQGGPGGIDDHTKNHRYFEAAMALGSVGLLAHDSTLIRWSTVYAWKGIQMQRASGVMPEDGGHDSGYQALGMVNASRYLELLARGSLGRALREALALGETWELSRVRPDGSINQAGDTRTSGCQERDPAGQCKTVFYAPIFSALAHWAAISGEQRFARAAHRVWQRSGYGGS
ncbi:MAG: hypothetical protein ACRDFX_04265 [Chloroflexota bacterium]